MRMPLINLKIHWRTIQICINICSVVTGFCAFLSLGYVTKMFVNHCVLYGDVKISTVDDTSVVLESENSKWGGKSTCNFAIYTTVIASIHAFIWIWFFLTMKAELKKEGAEFPILLASFLLHGLAMVAVFISSGVISAGVDTFCGNLARELNTKSSGHIKSCAAAQELPWALVGEQYSFHKYLMVSKISSWLCVVTIMCQFLVCGYKLYVWALQITLGTSSTPVNEKNAKTNGYKPVDTCDVTKSDDVTNTNSGDYSEETPTCSSYLNGNGHGPARQWVTSTTSDTSTAKMV